MQFALELMVYIGEWGEICANSTLLLLVNEGLGWEMYLQFEITAASITAASITPPPHVTKASITSDPMLAFL